MFVKKSTRIRREVQGLSRGAWPGTRMMKAQPCSSTLNPELDLQYENQQIDTVNAAAPEETIDI